MASIHKEVVLDVGVEQAWSAVRDVANAKRLFADVLVDSQLEGDIRTVTFANGMKVRERIIDIDDGRRRVAYAAQGAPFEHHHASMEIVRESGGRSRFVWISDFLPNGLESVITPLIDEGCRSIKRNLQPQTER